MVNIKELDFGKEMEKQKVIEQVNRWIGELGLDVVETDFDRPWGGFWKLNGEQAARFLEMFFPDLKAELMEMGLNLSPKFLLVAPDKRLSWQFHFLRAEAWRDLIGPVGVFSSQTDEQPKEAKILNPGEMVRLDQGERHRLVGLGSWGLVAEVWIHTDPNHPSTEEDIVRLADDTGRK